MSSHYKPQHPLPEELQNLSRDDTVCQFCGVSYLIHNEIKRLEDKLQEYIKEVERLKAFDIREQALQKEVSLLKINSEELLKKCEDETNKSKILFVKVEENEMHVRDLEKTLLSKNVTIQELVDENTKLRSQKKSYYNRMDQLRNLVIGSRKDTVDIKDTIVDVKNEYNILFINVKQQVNEKVNAMIKHWNELMENTNNQHETLLKKMKDTFEESRQNIINTQRLEVVHVEEKYKKRLEEYFENKKQLINEHVQMIKEYEVKNESLTKKIQVLNIEYSKLCNESSVEREELRNEVISLEKNLKTLQENENTDKQGLLNVIQNLKEETQSLRTEREKMIIAHQHRIQDLRESFLQKLKEADKWPEKMQEELVKQRKLLSEENEKQQMEIVDAYKKDILEKESHYNKTLSEEACKRVEIEKKLKVQLEDLQQSSENKMKMISQKLDQTLEEKERFRISTSKRISELEGKLSRETSMGKSTEDINLYKHRMSELEKLLKLTKDDITHKTKTIIEHENELQVLRDCVRRECEERYELTEALAVARNELLAIQRYYGNTNTIKQRTVFPSPPTTGRENILVNQDRSSIQSFRSTGFVNVTNSSASLDVGINSRINATSDGSRERIQVAMGRRSKNSFKMPPRSSCTSDN